jgi:hypothetical protein
VEGPRLMLLLLAIKVSSRKVHSLFRLTQQ